jgi:GNAT superfamily N-acetyltransferase
VAAGVWKSDSVVFAPVITMAARSPGAGRYAPVIRAALPLWTERLASPDPRARTILAEIDGAVVGLAHTLLGEHPAWGAYLDNLHVAHGLKRQGIGARLLALTGQEVVDWSPSSGLYLWVLEQNSDARAFYAARGGACVERSPRVPEPGALEPRTAPLFLTV